MADFGTRAFTGLNTQTAKHLIGDGELTTAQNVNYDELGGVKAEYADSEVSYSGSGIALAPDGAGFADISGTATYLFKDTLTGNPYLRVYDGSAAASTIHTGAWDNSDRLYVHQGDDEAILTDGGEPYVYNGSVVRKLGPLEATGIYEDYYNAPLPALVVKTLETPDDTINGLTVAGDGTVTVEMTGHSLSTGDRIYIEGVVGATEVNGFDYTVTKVDANNVTLDGVDGSDWGSYSSGGDVYFDASGLTGTYQYKVSYTITLPGGRTIESSPVAVNAPLGGETVDLTAKSRVEVIVHGFVPADIAGYIPNTTYVSANLDATSGSNIQLGAKVYRTKADGSAFYVAKTGSHTDVYNATIDSIWRFYDTQPDKDLGAAWEQSTYDAYDAPPDCKYFATANGYSYCLDADNPTRLHVSLFGDYDHWPATRYVEFPGVTAIAPAGDYVAIFSKTRMWYYAYDSSGGAVKEIPVQAGVGGPEAVVSTSGPVAFSNDLGLGVLFFANDLGLWKADPGGAIRISDHVKDDWAAAGGGTWAGAILGDKMIWACDTGSADSAFVIKVDRDGAVWGRVAQQASQDYELFFSDPIGNKIIAQCADGLYEFAGDADTEKTMTVKSKLYGGRGFCTATRVFLDLGAGASGTLSLTSDLLASASTYSVTNSGSQRTLVPVETGVKNGHFWQLQYSGTGSLYGWHLIVNENQRYY